MTSVTCCALNVICFMFDRYKVPWFTINLDLAPEERWKEVATNRKVQVTTEAKGF